MRRWGGHSCLPASIPGMGMVTERRLVPPILLKNAPVVRLAPIVMLRKPCLPCPAQAGARPSKDRLRPIHPCGTCTCTDRKGGTSGTAPLPVSGRGRGRGPCGRSQRADDVRAKVFTACLALRTIEKTGDSSTSLRMTCFAISVRETRRSYLRPTCHAAETCEKVGRTFLSARLNSWHGNGDGKKARPACFRTVVPWKAKGRRRLRANVFTACLALRTIEQTGDSSPALRMTCFAIAIGETCQPGLGTNGHPEESLSAVPGTGRRQADEGSTAA